MMFIQLLFCIAKLYSVADNFDVSIDNSDCCYNTLIDFDKSNFWSHSFSDESSSDEKDGCSENNVQQRKEVDNTSYWPFYNREPICRQCKQLHDYSKIDYNQHFNKEQPKKCYNNHCGFEHRPENLYNKFKIGAEMYKCGNENISRKERLTCDNLVSEDKNNSQMNQITDRVETNKELKDNEEVLENSQNDEIDMKIDVEVGTTENNDSLNPITEDFIQNYENNEYMDTQLEIEPEKDIYAQNMSVTTKTLDTNEPINLPEISGIVKIQPTQINFGSCKESNDDIENLNQCKNVLNDIDSILNNKVNLQQRIIDSSTEKLQYDMNESLVYLISQMKQLISSVERNMNIEVEMLVGNEMTEEKNSLSKIMSDNNDDLLSKIAKDVSLADSEIKELITKIIPDEAVVVDSPVIPPSFTSEVEDILSILQDKMDLLILEANKLNETNMIAKMNVASANLTRKSDHIWQNNLYLLGKRMSDMITSYCSNINMFVIKYTTGIMNNLEGILLEFGREINKLVMTELCSQPKCWPIDNENDASFIPVYQKNLKKSYRNKNTKRKDWKKSFMSSLPHTSSFLSPMIQMSY